MAHGWTLSGPSSFSSRWHLVWPSFSKICCHPNSNFNRIITVTLIQKFTVHMKCPKNVSKKNLWTTLVSKLCRQWRDVPTGFFFLANLPRLIQCWCLQKDLPGLLLAGWLLTANGGGRKRHV